MRKLILFFIILTLTLTVGCASSSTEETASASTTTGEASTTTDTPASTAETASTTAESAPATTEAASVVDEPTPATGELELTLEELAKYDGSDGNPAYIAIDGIIYDVSSVKAWFNGKHNGYTAGNDLTTEMKDISPHGLSKLKGLPVVGKLVK